MYCLCSPDGGVSGEGVGKGVVQYVGYELHKLCCESHGSWDGEVGVLPGVSHLTGLNRRAYWEGRRRQGEGGGETRMNRIIGLTRDVCSGF